MSIIFGPGSRSVERVWWREGYSFFSPFRCRCDRPSSINSDCKTTTRTGVPLDTCINNTRHSVFFLRADWFLYFSVLRKLLCEPPNWIFNTGFYATKPNILLYIYIYTKGRSLILAIYAYLFLPRFIRVFLLPDIFQPLKKRVGVASSSWWVGKKFHSFGRKMDR